MPGILEPAGWEGILAPAGMEGILLPAGILTPDGRCGKLLSDKLVGVWSSD